MEDEVLHTEEELDGQEEQNNEDEKDKKISQLVAELEAAKKERDEIKEKYHNALEVNNKLYKRLTTADEPPKHESELDKLKKIFDIKE